MSVDITIAKELFEQRFERPPTIAVRAPGRVNIIGEHTDYNHGYVLPMAIERDTVIVCTPREDRTLNTVTSNLNQQTSIDLNDLTRSVEHPWSDYMVGVAKMLRESEYAVKGADVLVMGDVPLGCGLSSSASLEMATLSMFESLGDFQLPDTEAAELCSRVENQFLGLSSGIMDQFISRLARKDHALYLDCRTLEYQNIPAQLSDAQFVIANTNVSRSLTESKYNERVDECENAVRQLNGTLNATGTHLRDFDTAQLATAKDALGDIEYRRARHVITENERTINACEALRNADLHSLGTLMNASDTSLDEDYAVSCDELRTMTRLARSLEGCYGSRMTGAGFGGCTISLVAREHIDTFASTLKQRYDEATGLSSEIIVSSPARGAESITLESLE